MSMNLVGKKFNRLTVLKEVSRRGYNRRWLCKCDCGKELICYQSALKALIQKSCGCYKLERMLTHGMSGGKNRKISREYKTWQCMKERCLNPKAPNYWRYGGKGILVCKRWLDFNKFFLDMGKCPKSHLLDRIDNEKGYSKSNCRWASYITSSNNRRNTVFVLFKNQTKPLADWCRALNLKRDTVYMRLKAGWTVEEAFQK